MSRDIIIDDEWVVRVDWVVLVYHLGCDNNQKSSWHHVSFRYAPDDIISCWHCRKRPPIEVVVLRGLMLL